MKRKKMGKIKYVYIEKKKCDFSQQIVAIFFLLLDNRIWGTILTEKLPLQVSSQERLSGG